MLRRALLIDTGAATAAALLGASTAQANTPNATALPPELGANLGGAQLSGTARLRFFGLAIYDARLWVSAGFRSASYADHALGLELSYLRALRGRAIAERSIQEMRHAATLADDVAQRWLVAMTETFVDVKAGDRLAGLHQPGVGAKFWFNGQPRPAVPDAEFSRRFFGIWLSDHTSEPQLRAELLARAAP